MKAILMSIRPEWVAKILNGEKTIEIRKKFPSDYVGWVYIYCTINGGCIAKNVIGYGYSYYIKGYTTRSGRVVARFWCDKVEKTKPYMDKEQQKLSCLSTFELMEYLQGKTGYVIHITKLEIFDEPKEISEFYGAFTQKRYERIFGNNAVELDGEYGGLRQPTKSGYEYKYPLTRAPQSWCYIEI